MAKQRRTPEDFAAEVEAHLALETERLIAEGWSPTRPGTPRTAVSAMPRGPVSGSTNRRG